MAKQKGEYKLLVYRSERFGTSNLTITRLEKIVSLVSKSLQSAIVEAEEKHAGTNRTLEITSMSGMRLASKSDKQKFWKYTTVGRFYVQEGR